MDEVKRRPGRPKGSEIDDSVPLMAMARLITDRPGLPPKTAARRVFKASSQAAFREDASIHRWHGKWRTAGTSYMQRVQAERAAAEAERQRRERAQRSDPRTAQELFAAHRQYVSDAALERASGVFLSAAYARIPEILKEEAARADVFREVRRQAEVCAEQDKTMARICAEAREAHQRLYASSGAVAGFANLAHVSGVVASVERTMRAVGAIPHMPKLPKGV